eukprot:CAMPEP_0181210692 /NCGR_PEP_ID=MMETSP1096-20121128/23376_1 /TAXON_ID=156174 ORGANISM="Chrysochromulina ericina, Strain CCMP281" /NCGR_SAMPLE_ID=MMETSP1096 /ASSEMBLY_ACC=CAM_ASM_000453 /LENGTH=70 /DNA_ID=CAMNT_0023302019 /DNA_START=192 /DNA_END=404 /DNA_ORIENTATION=-
MIPGRGLLCEFISGLSANVKRSHKRGGWSVWPWDLRGGLKGRGGARAQLHWARSGRSNQLRSATLSAPQP